MSEAQKLEKVREFLKRLEDELRSCRAILRGDKHECQ
jgi:hypothetical protein